MRTLRWLGAAWLVFLAQAAVSAAVVPSANERRGFFIEFGGHYASFIASDLDGRLVLGKEGQLFFIPKIESAPGFVVSLGNRFKSGMWAVSYLRSVHDASIQAGSARAVSHLVQVNGRTLLLKKGMFRPYLLLGLCFPWLTVENGSSRGKALHDATYLGVGVNAGAGMQVALTPRLFLSGSAVYRYIGYLYIRGFGDGIDATNLFVNGNGPRRTRFLKAPLLAVEISLGFLF